MNNVKNKIIDYFGMNDKFLMKEDLKKNLKIKGEEETKIFLDSLNELVEEGFLFFDEKKGYRIFKNELGFAYGEIEINKAGNGFVHTKDGYTIFISSDELNGALDGDKVMVTSIDFGRKEQYRGEVYKVLKRRKGNVVFEVVGTGYEATLIPYDKNELLPINVNKNQLKNLVDGDLVVVNVGVKKEQEEYLAEIIEVIGHKDDPNMDLKLIYMKYDVPIEFSDEALKELENIPTEVKEEELKDRVDLREKRNITIDCDDTKDRDDAICIEKLLNGNFKLYTSISSVNYYVKRGMKLFEEALIRCTSHYPNNTCNPMFPHKLSNGICSLNEKVDRLTKTCEMEINPQGEVVDYNIYNSVINSKKAMKYSEVNRVLKGENVEGYTEFVEDLKLLEELNKILENARIKRASIDFDIPDIKIVQDEAGKATNFKTTGTGLAERIIENCMLVTNTTVAEHYSWLPFIYRVHEVPNPQTVKSVIKLLRLSGFNMPKCNNIDEHTINSILDKIKDSEEAKIVRTILLKAMKRARYDVNNVGHFALQLPKYTHFTSPIRRISDFMVHTIIDEFDSFDYKKESVDSLEKELLDVCKAASNAERISILIEAEALAMSMAEYMEQHIGEEFNGHITEIYQHGMFVKTDNMISGKIKFENMLDDKYYYDDDKKAIIGKTTKKKYQIGNKVCVVAKDACKETRTINFEIGKQKSLRKN